MSKFGLKVSGRVGFLILDEVPFVDKDYDALVSLNG